jgi:hypothetical protein
MLVNYSVTGGQAKAITFLSGGKKRIEYTLKNIWSHTDTGIGNRNFDVVSGFE